MDLIITSNCASPMTTDSNPLPTPPDGNHNELPIREAFVSSVVRSLEESKAGGGLQLCFDQLLDPQLQDETAIAVIPATPTVIPPSTPGCVGLGLNIPFLSKNDIVAGDLLHTPPNKYKPLFRTSPRAYTNLLPDGLAEAEGASSSNTGLAFNPSAFTAAYSNMGDMGSSLNPGLAYRGPHPDQLDLVLPPLNPGQASTVASYLSTPPPPRHLDAFPSPALLLYTNNNITSKLQNTIAPRLINCQAYERINAQLMTPDDSVNNDPSPWSSPVNLPGSIDYHSGVARWDEYSDEEDQPMLGHYTSPMSVAGGIPDEGRHVMQHAPSYAHHEPRQYVPKAPVAAKPRAKPVPSSMGMNTTFVVPEDENEPFYAVAGACVGKWRFIDHADPPPTDYDIRICADCRTDQPGGNTWRRSMDDKHILCNKCGIYQRTHHRQRPPKSNDHRACFTLAELAVREPGQVTKGKNAAPSKAGNNRKPSVVPIFGAVQPVGALWNSHGSGSGSGSGRGLLPSPNIGSGPNRHRRPSSRAEPYGRKKSRDDDGDWTP